MNTAFVRDLGIMDYKKAHALQLDLVEKRRTGRMERDVFLLTEHPAVVTLGRRGGREHLAVSEDVLRDNNVAIVAVERGGNITFHGIGQLVVYPIIRLKTAGFSVTEYVFRLEEVMLRLSREYGVVAGRDARNRGVWVGDHKLGSVGIAIRHGIAFHGLALNISPCLRAFEWIHPCGLSNTPMTSLARELNREIAMETVKQRCIIHLAAVFGLVFLQNDALREGDDHNGRG